MKILKIEDSAGWYLLEAEQFVTIDKITKEALMKLVTLALEREVDFDDYDESLIKNQAHQIVYKSVLEKLRDLKSRKQEFKDESERLFSKEYEKYNAPTPENSH